MTDLPGAATDEKSPSAERPGEPAPPFHRVEPRPALKVLFQRKGRVISVCRVLELERADPGLDYRPKKASELPFVYEVKGKGKRTLFRGFGSDPTGVIGEYLSPAHNRHGHTFTQTGGSRATSFFSLTLPRIAGAEEVWIYSDAMSRAYGLDLSKPVFQGPMPGGNKDAGVRKAGR